MNDFYQAVTEKRCVTQSIRAALVVGTILGVINHFDAIIDGSFDRSHLVQVVITYFVPYCVSSYGYAMRKA